MELSDNRTNKWESEGEAGCHFTCKTSKLELLLKRRSSKLEVLERKKRMFSKK